MSDEGKDFAMKSFFAVCAALALAGCASVPQARVEEGKIVVDSPFDLVIGSTEYAKMLGDAVRSGQHVWKRGGVLTTNFWCSGSGKLSRPYYGFDTFSLSFSGEDRKLESVHFWYGESPTSKSEMSLSQCREVVRRMAKDFESRTGVAMECTSDQTDEEAFESAGRLVAEMEEERKKSGRDVGSFSTSFIRMHGTLERNGLVGDYSILGMISDKRKCEVSLTIENPGDSRWPSMRRKGEIPVYTNSTASAFADMPLTDKQKKAHDEAAKMRETLKRLFGVDFDKPEQTVELPLRNITEADKGNYNQREWNALEKPFGGMDERKLNQSARILFVPLATVSLRHAFEGDAPEEARDALAKEFLEALEKEVGAKIPPVENKDRGEFMKRLTGDGKVPTIGDISEVFRSDAKSHFAGRIGDIMLEIKSAPPRYVFKNGRHEVAIKGAVVVSIVQSSFFAN